MNDIDSTIELPGLLVEIEGVVGRNAAIKLGIACGGTRIYFPAHMHDEHWIADTIGYQAAIKLAEHFTFGRRGVRLDVPMIPLSARIADIDKGGRSAREIALMLGITERTVHRNRSEKRNATATKSRRKG